MSGAALTLDATAINTALATLHTRLDDMTPAMEAIGEIIVSQAMDSFERQAAPDGTPWTPSQRVLAKGGQTLLLTGALHSSLRYEAGPDSAEAGSGLVYSLIHQLGGDFSVLSTRRRVSIEARPYLPDEDSFDWSEATATVEDFLAEVF